jgi:hypothetical protein
MCILEDPVESLVGILMNCEDVVLWRESVVDPKDDSSKLASEEGG